MPPSEPQSTPTPEDQPTICLDQFLKTCGVATGGQAKRMIQGGDVWVNGELETRRRRKLRPGDEVQLFDDIFVVAWESESSAEESEESTQDHRSEPDDPTGDSGDPPTPDSGAGAD